MKIKLTDWLNYIMDERGAMLTALEIMLNYREKISLRTSVGNT